MKASKLSKSFILHWSAARATSRTIFFGQLCSEFIDSNAPKEIIRGLLKGYVERNLNREKQLMLYTEEMGLYFLSIQSALKGHNLEFHNLTTPPDGILRVFVCNCSGEQISPNYEVVNDQGKRTWIVDNATVGSNWSMRPYFYPGLGSKAVKAENHVASQPYRDVRADGCVRHWQDVLWR